MGKKILVVDDQEDIRNLLTASLETCGHEIRLASDGAEAWEALQNQKPDLLITDINMPNLSGLELLRKIREHPDLKDLPVIMLTGQDSDAEILSGLSRGADHYITKPFTIKSVLNGIQMVTS